MAREQILIVEDEPSVSELLDHVLQRVGFSVAGIVESGEEALARVAERRPDLVLMDIKIQGGMDGIKLAGVLEDLHNVPVIFLTGQTDKETLARVRATNSFGYLVKPFRFEELIAGIEFALAKSREVRTLREEALSRSREELRRLASHLQTAREEERTIIAREIHDELGQLLAGFKMDLAWIEKRVEPDADPERRAPLLAKLSSMREILQDMVRSVRRISAELRPPVLDDGGLPAALEWLAKDFERRSGLPCQLDMPVEQLELPPAMATALFRIVQESLTNVLRHANATRVQVELWDEEGSLHLQVRDNGCGILEGERQGERTFGLIGMRERAQLLGGEFKITGSPGAGTAVFVRVPLETAAVERKRV